MNHAYSIPLVILALWAGSARAEITTSVVDYQHDGTRLRGYLAYDGAVKDKRPGVLVIHEWWGLNDFAKSKARELAAMGYVAFAADMYGDGITTTEAAKAKELATPFGDRNLRRGRVRAAFDQLRAHPLADPDRIAAIGFCFGGTSVLELAYSGAPVRGVVSFHGGLTAPAEEDLGGISSAFLVLHGADDPMVPPSAIEAFQAGMRKSGADWQMVYFGSAVHAFTNPDAGRAGIDGVAYNEKAAKRGWAYMKDFFDELFK